MRKSRSFRARAASRSSSRSDRQPLDLVRKRSTTRSRTRSRSRQGSSTHPQKQARRTSRPSVTIRRAKKGKETSTDAARQSNKDKVAFALTQNGGKRGVGSAAIAPQIESIKRHQKFKQLATYSIDCITKVIDPIDRNWVWNLVECIERHLATAAVDVLTLHPNDDHVLLTVSRCLALLAPYLNPLACILVESGAFESALSCLSVSGALQSQEILMVLKVLVEVSDNASGDIQYSDESIDITEDLLQMHPEAPGIKHACLKLLLNMSRVVKCAEHLAGSQHKLGQVFSLLEDNDGDVVNMSLQILNNLGQGAVSNEADEIRKIIDALKSHMSNEHLLQSGHDFLDKLVGEDGLELAIKKLQEFGVSDMEIWFAESLNADNSQALVERGVLSNLKQTLQQAREAASTNITGTGWVDSEQGCLKMLQMNSRTITHLAADPSVIDAIHSNDITHELLHTYHKLGSELKLPNSFHTGFASHKDLLANEDTRIPDHALAAVIDTLSVLVCSNASGAQLQTLDFVPKLAAVLTRLPALPQHAVAVCNFVSALSHHSEQEVGNMVPALLAVLAAHSTDPAVQGVAIKTLLDIVSAHHSDKVDNSLNDAVVASIEDNSFIDTIINCMQKNANDRSLMCRCMKLLSIVSSGGVGGKAQEEFTTSGKLAVTQIVTGLTTIADVCYRYCDHKTMAQDAEVLVHNICKHYAQTPSLLSQPMQYIDQALKNPTDDFLDIVSSHLKVFCFFGLAESNIAALVLASSTNGVNAEHCSSLDLLLATLQERMENSTSSENEQVLDLITLTLHATLLVLNALNREKGPGFYPELIRQLVKISTMYPSQVDGVIGCLASCAKLNAAHEVLAEAGAADLFFDILRSNPVNFVTSQTAATGLLHLSQSSESRHILGKLGGAHQCIQYIRHYAEDEERIGTILPVVQLMQSLSVDPEIRQLFKIQNATKILARLQLLYQSNLLLSNACQRAISSIHLRHDGRHKDSLSRTEAGTVFSKVLGDTSAWIIKVGSNQGELLDFTEIDVSMAVELEAIASDLSDAFSMPAPASVGSAATVSAARTMIRALQISAEQANVKTMSPGDRFKWESALSASVQALASLAETADDNIDAGGLQALQSVKSLIGFYESLTRKREDDKRDGNVHVTETGASDSQMDSDGLLAAVKQTRDVLEKVKEDSTEVRIRQVLGNASKWIVVAESIDTKGTNGMIYSSESLITEDLVDTELREDGQIDFTEIDVSMAVELEAIASDLSDAFSMPAPASVGSAATVSAARTMIRALQISAEQANVKTMSPGDRFKWESALSASVQALASLAETADDNIDAGGLQALQSVKSLIGFYESLTRKREDDKRDGNVHVTETGASDSQMDSDGLLAAVKQTRDVLENEIAVSQDSYEEYDFDFDGAVTDGRAINTVVVQDTILRQATAVTQEELTGIMTDIRLRIVGDTKTATLKIKTLASLASTSKSNRVNIAQHQDMISTVTELALHKANPLVANQALELFSCLSIGGLNSASVETQAAIIDFITPLLASILTEEERLKKYLAILIELAQIEQENIIIMLDLGLFTRVEGIIKMYRENTNIMPLVCSLLFHVMFGSDQRTFDVCNEFLDDVMSCVKRHHRITFNMAVRALGSMSVLSTNVPAMLRSRTALQVSKALGRDLSPNTHYQPLQDLETVQIVAELLGNLAFCQADELPEDCQHILLDDGVVETLALIITGHSFNKNVLCACFDTLANFQDNLEACDQMIQENVIELLFNAIASFNDDQQIYSAALYLMSVITESEWSAEMIDRENLSCILAILEKWPNSEMAEDILRILMNISAHAGPDDELAALPEDEEVLLSKNKSRLSLLKDRTVSNADLGQENPKLTLPELASSLAKADLWQDNSRIQVGLNACIQFVEDRCEDKEVVLKAWPVKYGKKGTFKKHKEGVLVLTSLHFYRFDKRWQKHPADVIKVDMRTTNLKVEKKHQGTLHGVRILEDQSSQKKHCAPTEHLLFPLEEKGSDAVMNQMILGFEQLCRLIFQKTDTKETQRIPEQQVETDTSDDIVERIVVSPDFSSIMIDVGGVENMVQAMIKLREQDSLNNFIKLFQFLSLDDGLAAKIATYAVYPIIELSVKLDAAQNTLDTETGLFSTSSPICGDPKIIADMLILFSQLAFGRDNVATLVQCDVIPMLCQALETFPGDLPIIRASLKVLDHIATDSEEYAALVCENGGLDAISSIADDYSWHAEIASLCKDAANTIKMMRAKFEQEQILSRRQLQIKQKETSSKVSIRLQKLNSATEDVDFTRGPSLKQGYLLKSTRSRIKWTKRYFVLGENHMRWYGSPEAAETDSKGDDQKQRLHQVQELVARGKVKPEIFDQLQIAARSGSPSSVKGRIDLSWKTEVVPHHVLLHRKHLQKEDDMGIWDLTSLVSSRLTSTFWVVNGHREFAFCADSKTEMETWISAIRHNIELRASYHNQAKLTLPELSSSLSKLDPWADDKPIQQILSDCIHFVQGKCEDDEAILKAWRVKAWGQSAVGQKLSIYKDRVLVLTSLACYRLKHEVSKVSLQSKIPIENLEHIEEVSGKAQDKSILYGMKIDFVHNRDMQTDDLPQVNNELGSEAQDEDEIIWQTNQRPTTRIRSQTVTTAIHTTPGVSSHVYYVVAPDTSKSTIDAESIRSEMVNAFQQVHAVEAADSRQLWKETSARKGADPTHSDEKVEPDHSLNVTASRVMDCDSVDEAWVSLKNGRIPQERRESEDNFVSQKNKTTVLGDEFTAQKTGGSIPLTSSQVDTNRMFATLAQTYGKQSNQNSMESTLADLALVASAHTSSSKRQRKVKRQSMVDGQWETEIVPRPTATDNKSAAKPDVDNQSVSKNTSTTSKAKGGFWKRLQKLGSSRQKSDSNPADDKIRTKSSRTVSIGFSRGDTETVVGQQLKQSLSPKSQLDSLIFAKNTAGLRKMSRTSSSADKTRKARAYEL